MLEALMYISAARPGITESDIEAILQDAVRRNQVEQITGALIFSGSIFIQILEGPPAGLDAVFQAIKKDSRHLAVSILAREPITQRRFASWSMAYRSVRGLLAEELHAQFGWDNAIRKILEGSPQSRSLSALSTAVADIINQHRVQWASSQF